MYRYLIEDLIKWKQDPDKKPLIIKGARQVGKTYLMLHFAKNYYKDYIYINFDVDDKVNEAFNNTKDPSTIITSLELIYGKQISAKDTLLIFDEIQENQNALTSLKYFNELKLHGKESYSIICAGSLLGLSLHKNTNFPVGQVTFLNLHPLSFKEFLLASGNENLVKILDDFADIKDNDDSTNLLKIFKDTFIKELKMYFYVGGMPSIVKAYLLHKDKPDFAAIRSQQQSLVESFLYDLSKHAPTKIAKKTNTLFNNIPLQLSKDNKKFVYKLLGDGERAKNYEDTLEFLINSNLVLICRNVNSVKLPLKAYSSPKDFKLFFLDIGLLSYLSNLSSSTIFSSNNNLFTEFNGSLTEQFVTQELQTVINTDNNLDIYYYSDNRSQCEVDFLLSLDVKRDRNSSNNINNNNNNNNNIEDNIKSTVLVPLEIKSSTNTKSKSLKSFITRFKPDVSVKSSLLDFNYSNKVISIPLYTICNIDKIIEKYVDKEE